MSEAFGGGTGDDWPVIVGLDESVSAGLAVDLAAREATVRSVPLRIVHAHHRPARQPSPESRAVLDATLERVAELHPGLRLEHTLVGGGAGEVLVDESGRAGLLVLGGLGGTAVTDLLGGAVLGHVLTRAHCPVLVTGSVATTPSLDEPVRVAVDGTVGSLNALRFGCDWALRHGTQVEAVHVLAAGLCDEPAPELDQRTPAEARLDGWVRTIAREYVGVGIRPVLVRDAATPDALVAASHGAAVLAVGTGPGGLLALMPGRIVPALIRKASSPVAVVRGWRSD